MMKYMGERRNTIFIIFSDFLKNVKMENTV